MMNKLEKWIRPAAFAVAASFAALTPAVAGDDDGKRDATYASFRALTKCAVTVAAHEKGAVTFESFRSLYIKLCAKPEADFLSKFVGNTEGRPRAAKMSEGATMINNMVRQAFDKTRELRR